MKIVSRRARRMENCGRHYKKGKHLYELEYIRVPFGLLSNCRTPQSWSQNAVKNPSIAGCLFVKIHVYDWKWGM